ncbi:MAG TPA: hypothetical protein VNO50_17675 [Pyrinomonadaceae bacterium]|nr:hypothetical protein [Pyrinomonadaceae bacterium]
MRIKTLLMIIAVTLFFPATAEISWAQKDGEAQTLSVDNTHWTTLKFANKKDKPECGLFISHSITGRHEDLFAVRVAHMHQRALFGKFKFPEDGWLYITPSRISFVVAQGDTAHAFDVPRTDLEKKGGTRFRMYFVGIQINLKERLPASDSREQKFVPFMTKDRKCQIKNQKPYSQLLERTINDFEGAVAEYKQLVDSLKQAGKIQQAPAILSPPTGVGPGLP